MDAKYNKVIPLSHVVSFLAFFKQFGHVFVPFLSTGSSHQSSLLEIQKNGDG